MSVLAWDLFYVEAPLSVPNHLVSRGVQAYHAGIAMHNSNGTSLAFEYDAANGVDKAVVPLMVNNTLVWHNEGVVVSDWNRSYWKRASLQARLSDATVHELLAYIHQYNVSIPRQGAGRGAPYYQPFQVVNATTGDIRVRSMTCGDFGLDLLAYAAKLGVSIAPLLPTRKTVPLLYSTVPLEIVADDDPALLEFWSTANKIVRMANVTSAMEAAAVLVGDVKRRQVAYMRLNGSNMRVKLAPPYCSWEYQEVQMNPTGAQSR